MTGKYGTPITGSLAKLRGGHPIIKGSYMMDAIDAGGKNNPFTLESEYATVAIVKFCGFIFRRFVNSTMRRYNVGSTAYTGDHSEDAFMSAFEEAWDSPAVKEIRLLRQSAQLPIYVSLKLTKSPCDVCTWKLINFMKAYDVRLRLKFLRIYEGGEGPIINSSALLALQSAGAALKFWDLLEKGYRKTNKQNQPHELQHMTRYLKQLRARVINQMQMDEELPTDAQEVTMVEKMSEELRKAIRGMRDEGLLLLDGRRQEVETRTLFRDPKANRAEAKIVKRIEFMSTVKQDYPRLLRTEPQVQLTPFVLNNHSNSLKSHGRNGPQRRVPEDGSSTAGWSREETSSPKNRALCGIMGGIMSL
jgi:Novel AID APOBEC clade 1